MSQTDNDPEAYNDETAQTAEDSVAEFNYFIDADGYVLNTAGNRIQGGSKLPELDEDVDRPIRVRSDIPIIIKGGSLEIHDASGNGFEDIDNPSHNPKHLRHKHRNKKVTNVHIKAKGYQGYQFPNPIDGDVEITIIYSDVG